MTEIYSISLLVYSSTFKGSECVWGFLNEVREPSASPLRGEHTGYKGPTEA